MPSLVPRTAIPGSSQSLHDRFAAGLGFFSLALGAAEVLLGRTLARAAGLKGEETLLRLYGGREIATGMAILAGHDATPWVVGRLVGDAADIATVAVCAENLERARTRATLGFLAAATVADAFCAYGLLREKGGRRTAIADYSNRSGFPDGIAAAREKGRGYQPAVPPAAVIVGLASVSITEE